MANKKPLVKDANGELQELQSTDKIANTDIVGTDPTNSATNVAQSIINTNLFQYANDGKTAIANAIVAKGGTATSGDTFSLLATEIGNISGGATLTGNAVVGDVIVGKTFYSNDANTKLTGTLTLTGDATAAQILSGKKVYTTDPKTQVTGTMTNKVGSATVIIPSTADQTIPQGYYGGASGDGKVLGDTNLIAANIKKYISLFGVTGTCVEMKYASGSCPSPTNGTTYATATLTGLSFTPKIVFCYVLSNTNSGGTTYIISYMSYMGLTYNNPNLANSIIRVLNTGLITTCYSQALGSPSPYYLTMTSDGFTIQLPKTTYAHYGYSFEAWGW